MRAVNTAGNVGSGRSHGIMWEVSAQDEGQVTMSWQLWMGVSAQERGTEAYCAAVSMFAESDLIPTGRAGSHINQLCICV